MKRCPAAFYLLFGINISGYRLKETEIRNIVNLLIRFAL